MDTSRPSSPKRSSSSPKKDDPKKVPAIIAGKYSLSHFLGKGTFASVYAVSLLSNPSEKYAMKVFDKTLLNEREVELLQNEVSIHKSMQFKGVIRFYESFTGANFIYIRMELCTRKTLKELLKKRKYLSEREVRYFAVQILLTV